MSLNTDFVHKLKKLADENLLFTQECDLTNFSTLKLKATGPLIQVKNLEKLVQTVKLLAQFKLSYHVLGLGSNYALKEFSNDPYLKLEFPYDKQMLTLGVAQQGEKTSLILPASMPISLMTSAAIKYGHQGWEYITGIPASLGGAVYMNAGTTLGEIKQIVTKIWMVTKEGQLKEHKVSKDSFSYRKNHFCHEGDIIYQVEVQILGTDQSLGPLIKDYFQKRKFSQPLDKNNCGCTFKNVSLGNSFLRAGHMIDLLGLKGFYYKGLQIDHKHANFLNHIDQFDHDSNQKSTQSDLVAMVRMIQEELYLYYGKKFEPELK